VTPRAFLPYSKEMTHLPKETYIHDTKDSPQIDLAQRDP